MKIKSVYRAIRKGDFGIQIGNINIGKKKEHGTPQVRTSSFRTAGSPYDGMFDYTMGRRDFNLYENLREGMPMFDRAIELSKDLMGDWEPDSKNQKEVELINKFKNTVRVNDKQSGLIEWRRQFVDSMLLYGTAFSEMIYYSTLDGVERINNLNPKNMGFKLVDGSYQFGAYKGLSVQVLPYQDLILYQTNKTKMGNLWGDSEFWTLPFIGQIMTRAFNAFDTVFWREANTTYFFVIETPTDSNLDSETINQISSNLESNVSTAMRMKRQGQAADVHVPLYEGATLKIQAIGADGKEIDYSIPMKTVLEQAAAGLDYPLFMFGLHSESSAYKLTTHQSERIKTKITQLRKRTFSQESKIISAHLAMNNVISTYIPEWDSISLTDKVEEARANLMRKQANKVVSETALNLFELGIDDPDVITDYLAENELIKYEKGIDRDRLRKMVKTKIMLLESKRLSDYWSVENDN